VSWRLRGYELFRLGNNYYEHLNMIGETVSHYKILQKLAEGGMGVIYLADDMELNRKIALKCILPQYTSDKGFKTRFKREAQASAALNHPNIITIYDVFEYKNRSYIAMEFVEGRSLKDLIAAEELSLSKVLDISLQICEGLSKAHHAGVVHRDIKPQNLLIDTDGRVKILDFGLAKLKEVSDLTSSSVAVGTAHYMSPELIQRNNVDHRSDIFSFGVVLYEMVTGQLPFKGDYEAALFYAILNEEPEPMSRFKTGVSDGLQSIVTKALDKYPETRYQNIEDIVADLKREKTSTSIPLHSIVTSGTDRKLVAIMFADIAGYSRMMGEDESETLSLLKYYAINVPPIIQEHNGVVLKKVGDSLFCEFSSALKAVEAAVHMQEYLNEYNQTRPERFKLLVRIGIHVGDVVRQDDDLFGDGVNIAARIQPLAEPGGICVSDSVFSAIRGHPEFQIASLGKPKLKNISLQQSVYRLNTKNEYTKNMAAQRAETRSKETSGFNENEEDEKRESINASKSIIYKKVVQYRLPIIILIFISVLGYLLVDQNWKSIPEGKDQAPIAENPAASSLIHSALIEQLAQISDTNVLMERLEIHKQALEITYGNKDDFDPPDGCYVFVVDEQKVSGAFRYHDNLFLSVNSREEYSSLTGVFAGKTSIWVKDHTTMK
jgi:serine/threonine protein kinase